MKKRLLSLLMILALVLSLCPAALAAGTGARETGFFTDHNAEKRTDLKFSGISYADYRMDWDEFDDLLYGIYDLMGAGTEDNDYNTAEIAGDFAALCDMIEMTWTMERFTSLQGYLNYANDDAWDDYYDNYTGGWVWGPCSVSDDENGIYGDWIWYEAGEYYDEATGAYNEEADWFWVPGTWDEELGAYCGWQYYYGPYWYTWDYFYALVHDLLTADCGYDESFLRDYFPGDDSADYRCLDYYLPEEEPYYDYDTNAGLLDNYEYYTYYKAYYPEAEFQELVGGIYIEMVQNWTALAQASGYENYMKYVYASYGRDYTPEEIGEFEAAVKEYLVPVYLELRAKNDETLDMSSDVFTADYTTDEALESLRPYLADMSSELLASFEYMVEHEMYDIQATDTKYYGGAFTDRLYSFGTPFLFSDPYTGGYNMINFTTNVHEFGHYNAMYYDPLGWLQIAKADDIMETHSQGLELLMTHYYPQIFGEDAETVTSYFMEYFLGTLVWQCLRDEFEQYAFTAAAEDDELTVQALNRKYYELEVEYGIISAENVEEDGEDASWMEINHFFSYPCYLISYATSLSGAFSFWLEAQDDFYGAVDDYLEFCALDVSLGFKESFAAVNVESPISSDYVKDLAKELTEVLLTEEPDDPYVPYIPYVPDTPDTPDEPDEPAVSFLDVPDDAWYRDAVDYVAENGLMEGVGGGRFAPELNLSRGQIVTILYRLEGEPAVSGTSGFSDVEDGTWYTDAVTWAAASGIVTGYDNAAFGPNDDITRQDMAVILYRYAQYKGYDVSVGEDTNILSYSDAESVSEYAIPAMQWACGSGILQGTDAGTLAPTDSTNRAMFAAILMRFAEL